MNTKPFLKIIFSVGFLALVWSFKPSESHDYNPTAQAASPFSYTSRTMEDGIFISEATELMNLDFGLDALDFALLALTRPRNLVNDWVYFEGRVLAVLSPASGAKLGFFCVARLRIWAARLAAAAPDNPLVYFFGTFLLAITSPISNVFLHWCNVSPYYSPIP